MNRCKLIGRVALVFAVGFTLGPAAWAADMSGSWLGVPKVVWAWANLFVFWGLLWHFAGPPMREFLQKRKQSISEGLNRAQEQAAEAERMRSELSAQLDEFRRELSEQKDRAREEAQRERERILAQAEAERIKLLEQTERGQVHPPRCPLRGPRGTTAGFRWRRRRISRHAALSG